MLQTIDYASVVQIVPRPLTPSGAADSIDNKGVGKGGVWAF